MDALTKSQQDIVISNHKLIYKVLHKYNLDVEEFYGAAAVGLCKAAKTFKPELGYAFSTYAYKVMANEINKEFRSIDKHQKLNLISGEEVIHVSENGDEITLFETLSSDENIEDTTIDRITADVLLENFKQSDKDIFIRYALGESQVEIARDLGVSRANISRIIQKIRNKVER